MSTQDFGAEDFEWPDVSSLKPAEALRLLDDIEREAREANKRADVLKRRKAQAKQVALAVLEEFELDSAKTTVSSGQKVLYSTYDFDVFTVDDDEAFREWAETQSESYFDPTPKLRQQIFLDEMRRRAQDGEPLPPGVRKWSDTRLSRTSVQSGRQRSTGGFDK